jgi:hypothetical protein
VCQTEITVVCRVRRRRLAPAWLLAPLLPAVSLAVLLHADLRRRAAAAAYRSMVACSSPASSACWPGTNCSQGLLDGHGCCGRGGVWRKLSQFMLGLTTEMTITMVALTLLGASSLKPPPQQPLNGPLVCCHYGHNLIGA